MRTGDAVNGATAGDEVGPLDGMPLADMGGVDGDCCASALKADKSNIKAPMTAT
jgi:hypothetical protein